MWLSISESIKFLQKQVKEKKLFYEISKLIKKGKLIICDDLSSGFLQNLSLNCPTICYLPLGLSMVHSENKKDS